MKLILMSLLAAVVYVFWPTYDLLVRAEAASKRYTLMESGFYSRAGCEQLGQRIDPLRYRCDRTTRWTAIFGNYTRYDPAIRETQKRLAGQQNDAELFDDLANQ
mgnify:CR=1 FL=1